MKDLTTAALAEFLAGTRFDALPAGAVHDAKRAIYNWFGLTLQARDHPAVNIAREWVLSLGGSGATVVGGARHEPPLGRSGQRPGVARRGFR